MTDKQAMPFKTWIYEIARNVWHDYAKNNPNLTDLTTGITHIFTKNLQMLIFATKSTTMLR